MSESCRETDRQDPSATSETTMPEQRATTDQNEELTVRIVQSEHEFDDRFRDFTAEITDDWSRSSIRTPEFIQAGLRIIKRHHNAGIYKARTAMLLYGFETIGKLFGTQLQELKDAYPVAINKNLFVASDIMDKKDQLYYERALKGDPGGFFSCSELNGRIEDRANYFGVSRGCLIRHCLAIAAAHSQFVDAWTDLAKEYEYRFHDYLSQLRIPRVLQAADGTGVNFGQ